MEVAMSLNSLVRLPVTTLRRTHEDGLLKNSLLCPRITQNPRPLQPLRHRQTVVVQAKGRRGMIPGRQNPRRPPPLPKLEDDGNPKFVIFIREATLNFWFPLSVVTGGTTAKVMIAAKDNFMGKYIYKDALDKNLASVIYRDEKDIQERAKQQHRELRKFTNFRYGYKLVENGNLRAALSPSNVIQLPTPDKLKTVFDDVKDFFGKAKESFRKLTSLDTTSDEEPEENSEEKTKVKGGYKRKDKVAERALFLWNNDHIENLIKQNRGVILPIIFPVLEKNARNHWNQAVHSLTLNVRKIFYDLDPELFKECLVKFQEDESKEEEIKAKREDTWKRLEDLAAKKATSNKTEART